MMMMMKSPIILVISTLLFSSLAVQAYQGSFAPDKCCWSFYSSRLPMNRVVSYKYTDNRCSMEGVVMKMKKGHEICVDPSELWVIKLIEAKVRIQTN
nr:chemokine (C-C motif) ligand 38 [Sebastes schlegelii]